MLLTAGDVARRLGRFDHSEAVLRRAQHEARVLFGERSRWYAQALDCLGVVHKSRGEFAEALACYEQALALLEAGEKDCAGLASVHHNLGGLAYVRGDLPVAEHHSRTALKLRAAADGTNSIEVGRELAALAVVLDDAGRSDEAAKVHERAASLLAALPSQHPDRIAALANLAAHHQLSGHLQAAAKLLRTVLAAEQRLYGPRHPDVGVTLTNMSAVLAALGQHEQARETAETAVLVLEQCLDQSHPHIEHAREALRMAVEG